VLVAAHRDHGTLRRMTLRLPAIDPTTIAARSTSGYPEPYRSRVVPREKRALYVLEGEVVLRTDGGEQVLTAGMAAGFPAGSRDGHQLINRSDRPARYLEISNRDPEDTATYSDADVDLALERAADGTFVYRRRDGSRY